jgi:hypothetical protein
MLKDASTLVILGICKIDKGVRKPNKVVVMVGHQTHYQNFYKYFNKNCWYSF